MLYEQLESVTLETIPWGERRAVRVCVRRMHNPGTKEPVWTVLVQVYVEDALQQTHVFGPALYDQHKDAMDMAVKVVSFVKSVRPAVGNMDSDALLAKNVVDVDDPVREEAGGVKMRVYYKAAEDGANIYVDAGTLSLRVGPFCSLADARGSAGKLGAVFEYLSIQNDENRRRTVYEELRLGAVGKREAERRARQLTQLVALVEDGHVEGVQADAVRMAIAEIRKWLAHEGGK